MVTELTDDTFDKFIADNGIAVIDCWAPWCGPCRRMTPIMEKLSTELEGKAGVAKLNVDNNQAISVRFGIRAIPTLLVFKEGVLVDTFVGLRSKEELTDYVENM
ncbi:MAG: thioredoxin [Methanomassiliicoccaceae archaeon]|nr:thioredoxin [Methanomassiliicoccaceae archaeon]MCL2145963.1 thioredoxin [Methanomassiliicoccaceae archaeon]